MTLRKIAIVSAVAGVTAQYGYGSTFSNIAGYTPPTNVIEHNEIDLDQADIESALKVPDHAEAKNIYQNGKYSAKSSGMRTMAYMSKDLTGEVLYDELKAYYGDVDFGTKWVVGALDKTNVDFASGRGDANFASVSDDDTVEQATKKGTVQLVVWPYAIHELESAITKCGTDKVKALHYLDEAVAFYTGSLVGADATGDTKGKLMFALAESRCKDFVTCGSAGSYSTSGLAESTSIVFTKFDAFKAALNADSCGGLRALTQEITDAGYIPIIQGALKYAWTVGVDGGGAKYKAEAATFAAAVLPRVYKCPDTGPADAQIIYDNLKIGAATTDFSAVQQALQRNYECMGVTCTQIGGYYKDGAYKEDFSAECAAAPSIIPGVGMTGSIIILVVAGLIVVAIIAVILKKTVCKKTGKTASSGGGNSASA